MLLPPELQPGLSCSCCPGPARNLNHPVSHGCKIILSVMGKVSPVTEIKSHISRKEDCYASGSFD